VESSHIQEAAELYLFQGVFCPETQKSRRILFSEYDGF